MQIRLSGFALLSASTARISGLARWLRKMDKAVRARYNEVIDIYRWLGDFTAALDPDRDDDLHADLVYIDSMVAGWISDGQFENPARTGVRDRSDCGSGVESCLALRTATG